MNELDDAILEFLEALNEPGGEPVALSPTPVWVNLAKIRETTDKKQNTFSRRMNQLAQADLLRKVDDQRGYYVITEKGQQYLAGNLDAEALEEK
jgi:DNA-binding MarR family transcriptional regulator